MGMKQTHRWKRGVDKCPHFLHGFYLIAISVKHNYEIIYKHISGIIRKATFHNKGLVREVSHVSRH